MSERLQKILSRAGQASRREAEQMILEGRVKVNGQIVTALGTKADPALDAIRLDGRLVPRSARPALTLALNKPRGVVSTRRDPEGRRTVLDLLRGVSERLYPIGRLDYNAEGLMILTNDGDLAFSLLRPGGAERVYKVKVRGEPASDQIRRLERGMRLDGRPTLPTRVRMIRAGHNSWLEVGLREGRRNQIVRMFQRIGCPVMRLRRVRIGGLPLGDLPPGRWRPLGREEIEALRGAKRRPTLRRRGGP